MSAQLIKLTGNWSAVSSGVGEALAIDEQHV